MEVTGWKLKCFMKLFSNFKYLYKDFENKLGSEKQLIRQQYSERLYFGVLGYYKLLTFFDLHLHSSMSKIPMHAIHSTFQEQLLKYDVILSLFLFKKI